MGKTRDRARERDDIAKIIAKMHGVSTRYVNMIRSGDRKALKGKGQEILNSLVEFEMGKSKLIKHLEKLVPITPNTKRYAREKN